MSELVKVSGTVKLTTVRGSRLEYKWPATDGAGRKHLLGMLEELARLAAVDGAEREARGVVEEAFKRVADWRAEQAVTTGADA